MMASLQVKLDAERKRIDHLGRNALDMALEWTPAEKATYEDGLALVATSELRSFLRSDAEL
ncbi:hypothetical protein PI124_g11792 [Phytophthora idaei]|nr:hypothetical protein PI125_g11311 [Phytophthora idaei]KAG3152457.1 hypothetical protein PI126_g10510 [Phytophthora idaei]KAG3243393.1 hypothetical protein PI124_g11792 [Phytophthora idaei]